MQQGVQTEATCDIQQCWELMANNVASVYTQPKPLPEQYSAYSGCINSPIVLFIFKFEIYFRIDVRHLRDLRASGSISSICSFVSFSFLATLLW